MEEKGRRGEIRWIKQNKRDEKKGGRSKKKETDNEEEGGKKGRGKGES